MLEYWNVGRQGMKSGKRHILNVGPTFIDDAHQTSPLFSIFNPKILIKTINSMQLYSF